MTDFYVACFRRSDDEAASGFRARLHEVAQRLAKDDRAKTVDVASSPGTCHYEQLPVREALTPDAPDFDGIGLLSFASAADYSERLFDGDSGRKAIFDDVERFLDLDRGETLPASEFVYLDQDA